MQISVAGMSAKCLTLSFSRYWMTKLNNAMPEGIGKILNRNAGLCPMYAGLSSILYGLKKIGSGLYASGSGLNTRVYGLNSATSGLYIKTDGLAD